MNQSLNEFKQKFIDLQLDMAWRQWTALGVAGRVEPERKRAIDVEALIVYTVSIGHLDKRLLTVAIEWLTKNDEWINLSRLMKVLALYRRPVETLNNPVLSTEAYEYLAETVSTLGKKWAGLAQKARPYSLASEARQAYATSQLRSAVSELRLQEPALLQLALRSTFGVSARAGVFEYLLLNADGNSNSIAKEIYADQKNVYNILDKWSQAGIVTKIVGKKTVTYSLARKDQWFTLLGVSKKLIFINWISVFHLFCRITLALEKPPWADDEYLLSSIFRDFLDDARPIARQLGLDVPEPTLYEGAKYFGPISVFLIRVVRTLMD